MHIVLKILSRLTPVFSTAGIESDKIFIKYQFWMHIHSLLHLFMVKKPPIRARRMR